ncbi:uncharacterized protein [Rhodnius prolixus]|uniref:uncharacterized protein n=1 Tax=Rhodnius prolixus TaxID=13249 RepID=UPI003D18DA25
MEAGENVSVDQNNERKRKYGTPCEKKTKKRAKVSTDIQREPSPSPKNPCPICLGDLLDPDTKVEATPCAHLFCSDCLDRALKVRSMCPVCREPLEDLQQNINETFSENEEEVQLSENDF